MDLYDTCPYLKFAHFTANKAILDAFAGNKHVHVIDFSMNEGLQWPMLMQALAVRSEGPPTFRLTGIGPPSADGTDRLQDVGSKLARLAKNCGLKFRYRGFVAASLADLDASTLDLEPGEAVAVNSVFELHRLLAWPGAIEKVLSAVRDMNPEIVTVVEQEANTSSRMFDLLLLDQWRGRFESAGFAQEHIGSEAYKQASMLLAMFDGGNGYRVEANRGCLLLGGHLLPLIATSAWQVATR